MKREKGAADSHGNSPPPFSDKKGKKGFEIVILMRPRCRSNNNFDHGQLTID
ncbi:MAG: hypothetical protein GX659_06565 [Myxococcales bacterium]|nr:hypothetical protein [Myxococcales bacterium]